MHDASSTSCPFCGATASIVEVSYPGYRAGTRFQIAACEQCQVSFALPLVSDAALYDSIYAQQAVIPGYERYHRYATRITKERDALAFLANSEENYWAVSRIAQTLQPGAKILDVGCGLGYLTFALSRAGFDATGLDLSETAIKDARRRFGDHFVAADVFEWSAAHAGSYDLVVMLELIEHVEQPLKWLEAGRALLKPGGKLLLSTPNRDVYANGTVWETEAPPVHLWWFSANIFRRFASTINARVEIMDLTECNIAPQPIPTDVVRTVRSPILTKDDQLGSGLRRRLNRLGLLRFATGVHSVANRIARGVRRGDPSRRETLVAIFSA